MQEMQGDPEAERVFYNPCASRPTDLWRVYFICLDAEGNQDGEMEWCVVEAIDGDSAKERAIDAMETFYGQEAQWMSTVTYWEEDPEGWPDYLAQITEGVWQ